jgi:hypothetical protein
MRLFPLLLLPFSATLAQLTPGTITVTAVGMKPPDSGRIRVEISVWAEFGVEFDDVLRKLSPLEVSERDLVRVDLTSDPDNCPSSSGCVPPWNGVDWRFELHRPYAKARDLMAIVARLLAEPTPRMSMSFSTFAWPNDFGRECPHGNRILEARAHAEALASAAGQRVGGIIALSDGSELVYAPSEKTPSAGNSMGVPGSGPPFPDRVRLFRIASACSRTSDLAAPPSCSSSFYNDYL